MGAATSSECALAPVGGALNETLKLVHSSECALRWARTFARVVLCRHDVLVPDDLLGRVKRHQVELLDLGNSALVAGNLVGNKDRRRGTESVGMLSFLTGKLYFFTLRKCEQNYS